MAATRNRWNKEAKKLEGKTVKQARYMSKADAEKWGWYQCGLVVWFTDGTQMVLSQDDEGNGPGAAFLSTNGGDDTLPVIGLSD